MPIWILTLCVALLHASEPVERPPLVLGQNEQRLLGTPHLKRYALGSDLVRARSMGSDGGSILIKGVKPGITDLWVWNRDGSSEFRQIRVEKTGDLALSSPVLRALSGLQEVEYFYSGTGVILRGSLHSIAEAARVGLLVQGFPKEVHDETELSEELLTLAEKRIQTWLSQNRRADTLRTERVGGSLWVRGSVGRASDLKSVQKSLLAQFPRLEFEIDTLPDSSPTIYFRVFLLELKKSRFSSLGLGWPPTQAGAFSVTPSRIREAISLDVTLQALEGEGDARVLSNPELVVRAPGEAELFSGGELPIRTTTHYSSQITWKSFGLLLKLNVKNAAGNKIRLDIATEVSHLDSRIGEDSIPGLQANRMKTQVDAQYGVPLLLAGLLQQDIREQAKGLPLLRQIPILGLLFGSDDYLNERSELVAILLPHTSPPKNPLDRIQKAPHGAMPPPRNWVAPEQEAEWTRSDEYPWNALR